MGKGHRHQKNLKSEKAKVKLKSKTKHLPKGLNVTDTTFKVKKIVIREQLKLQNETEILSRRKLNVKDLLTRLQHYNTSVRQEAVRELKEILSSQYSTEVLSSQLNSLLQGVSALALDKERDIRRDSLKVLNLILSPISNEQLLPFFDFLISYLSCAMTHIDPNIKEDSLLFLDVMVKNCASLLAKNSHKVLPNFLDMISKLRTESQLDRQLTTTLNSKNTSAKWRIKVLSRLSNILSSIIADKKSQKSGNIGSVSVSEIVHVDATTVHVPLFRPNNLKVCQLNFGKGHSTTETLENSLDVEELKKYIRVLMPLMCESWIEVSPKDSLTRTSDLVISGEAALLLKTVLEIMQLLIDYIEMLEFELGVDATSVWFKCDFQGQFVRNLFSNFPYCEVKTFQRPRKRQEDFGNLDVNAKCLEQNLALCQIYVWFSSIKGEDVKLNSRDLCSRVVEYLNDRLESWSNADNPALPQLTKLLRTIFLRASKIWYKNHIDLGKLLQTVIEVYSRHSKKELQTQLFAVLSEIVLDHNLTELHSEEPFKEWIQSLPQLLLRHSIHQNTIRMLNRVVLQYKRWIEKELADRHDLIIDNAKKIEIIGSEDEKRSRLAIFNLFYFMDEQVYY